MDSEELLARGVELLESLALCDSLAGAGAEGPPCGLGDPAPADDLKFEGSDDSTFYSSGSSIALDAFGPEAAETVRDPGPGPPCANPGCASALEKLERKVRLLETQNAQLIVNACCLYNTLMRHIETLRAELKRRD